MYGKLPRVNTFGVAAFIVLCLLIIPAARTQQRGADSAADATLQRLANLEEQLRFTEETLNRRIDDLLLFRQVEDVAEVDKGRYTGPPPRHIKNPTAPGAANPVIVTAYTFLPKKRPAGTKLPLL